MTEKIAQTDKMIRGPNLLLTLITAETTNQEGFNQSMTKTKT